MDAGGAASRDHGEVVVISTPSLPHYVVKAPELVASVVSTVATLNSRLTVFVTTRTALFASCTACVPTIAAINGVAYEPTGGIESADVGRSTAVESALRSADSAPAGSISNFEAMPRF